MLALLPALACGGDGLVLPEDGVPTRIEIVGGNGQSGTVGLPLADSIAVRVFDAQSRPLPGQPVDFRAIAGGGTLAPASVQTDANGRAAARWILGASAGAQQAEAKAVGNGAPATLFVVFTGTGGASAATTLSKISGDNQNATAGSTLPDSLIVRVTDAGGNGVAGVSVTWGVSGGGTTSEPQTTTGGDGRTGVRRTLGTTAGQQATTATAGGLAGSPVSFTATAAVGSAGKLVITQQPSANAASGSAFAVQPRVQVRDANDNNVPGAGRAVTAELATGAGTLIGNATALTDADGLATFTTLGISGQAGTYTLNFTGLNLAGATSNSIQIGSGSATRLAVATAPSGSATSGVALSTQPQIQLQDASGNPVAQSGVVVTVSANVLSGSASLSGTTNRTTNGSGLASFTGLTLTGSAGSQVSLVFAAPGLTSTSAGPITIGAGQVDPANSTVGLNGSTITASTGSSGVTVTVTARDASGNTVAGAAVGVSVSGSGNTITPPSGTTNASGVFTTIVSSTQAGSKTISATINGQAVTQTAALTVNPAQPSVTRSLVSANPTSIAAGGASSTITVTVRDAFDNPVPGRTVTLSAPSMTITQPAAVTSATGVTTGSVSSTVVGPKTVTAAITGIGNIAQNAAVTVTTGAVSPGFSTLSLTGSPITASNGSSTAAITVTVRDAGNNPVPNASVELFATGAGHTFTPQSGTANASGVFNTTISSTLAGTKTVSAEANGTAITQTQTLTTNAAAPGLAQSLVSASPPSIEVVNGTSTITVSVRDAFNNPVPGRTVTLSASPPAGVNLTQPVGTTNAAGVITGSLSSTTQGAKVVSATVGGAGGGLIVQTATVTVGAQTVSAANSSVAVAPGTITASNGSSQATVTVTARDGSNNPIAGATVAITVSFGSNLVSTPAPTNASGITTATISSTEVGPRTVGAVINGIAINQTQPLTVNPGAADAGQSSAGVAPSTTTAGTAVTVSVTFRDQFGNPLVGAAVTLGSDKAGAFGAMPVLNASGQSSATFTPTESGTHQISATVGALTEQTTLTVNPAAPSAAQSSVAAVSPRTVGQASTLTVTVRDQFMNPVPGVTVTLAATPSGGSVTQPAAPTNASGIATGSFSSLLPTTYTISATAGALAITDNATVLVTP